MALTSFLSNASSTLSRATSNISTSAQTFNNSLSSFSNQIGNIESQISPQFIQNNLGNLQDKFRSVASPFTDALSTYIKEIKLKNLNTVEKKFYYGNKSNNKF